MVLTEDTVPLPLVSEALKDAGYRGVLSPDQAVTDISFFGEDDHISIDELERRFLTEDPRYDEYLLNIHRLFHAEASGKRYTVFFIPSNELSFVFAERIRSAFGGRLDANAYLIPEYVPWRQIFSLIFFAGIAGVALFRSGKAWPLLLPGTAAWIPLLVSEGDFTFAGACFLFLFQQKSLLAVREFLIEKMNSAGPCERKYSAVVACVIFGGVFLAYMLLESAAEHGGNHFPAVILGFLTACSSGIVALSIEIIAQDKRMHRLFIPVAIVPGKPAGIPRMVPGLVVSAVIILAGPFPAEFLSGASDAEVPVFSSAGPGYGFSWNSLEKLRSERNTGNLPDISDYLSHRALLDGFQFGRPYGMPSPGETIVLPVYVQEADGRVTEKREIAFVYDDAWIASAVSGTSPGSPERLFVTQGRPGAVHPGKILPVRLSVRYVLMHLLFFCVSLVLYVIPLKKLTSPTLYGMRNTLIRRDLFRKDRQVV